MDTIGSQTLLENTDDGYSSSHAPFKKQINASLLGCRIEFSAMFGQQRRDTLVNGLNRIAWNTEKPKGTMFVWAKIPEQFRNLGSVEFSKMLIQEAKVAVSPGRGFGEYGDDYVRFALVENEHRTNQAVRGLRKVMYQA